MLQYCSIRAFLYALFQVHGFLHVASCWLGPIQNTAPFICSGDYPLDKGLYSDFPIVHKDLIVPHWSIAMEEKLHYSRSKLYDLRHTQCAKPALSTAVLSRLKENGILRYRGCHSGSKRHRHRTTVKLPMHTILNANVELSSMIHVCCWNARSVRNKSSSLADYVISNDIDIMLITETWLRDDDDVLIGAMTPPGYSFINVPRANGRGGGVGAMFKSHLKFRQLDSRTYESIEHCFITDHQRTMHLVVTYI